MKSSQPRNEWLCTVWTNMLKSKDVLSVAQMEVRWGKALDDTRGCERLANAVLRGWFKAHGEGIGVKFEAVPNESRVVTKNAKSNWKPKRIRKSRQRVSSIFDYADRFKEAA